MNVKTIALLSQPNAGKSTLFNGLTGSKQHVGNWPGKTVEKKEGLFTKDACTYKVVDLPGSYSLSANSDEEIVTRDFILGDEADLIVLMVDASQCERSLYMLADYIGIDKPIMIVFNMIDIAQNKGITIDVAAFERELGVPCVAMSANNLKGYDDFYNKLAHAVSDPKAPQTEALFNKFREAIGSAYDDVHALAAQVAKTNEQAVWLTCKLIESDDAALLSAKSSLSDAQFNSLNKFLDKISNGNLLTANARFEWICALISRVAANKPLRPHKMKRLDRAFTGRFGKPLAIFIIIAALVVSFIPATPFMTVGMNLAVVLREPVMNIVTSMNLPIVVGRFFVEVVLMAIGFCLSMAGFVLGVSLVFGYLEETGYMARVSYVFDHTMSKMGLQGKSIMPMIVSLGCTMAGTGGARVIDTWGQKTLTIMLAWAVPCAATWSVIGLTTSTFFGAWAPLVIVALFIVVLFHFWLTAKLFGKVLVPKGQSAGLIMELPPYHKPKWRNLIRFVFGRFFSVFKKALKVVMIISAILWLLAYTPSNDITQSMIYKMGKSVEPVTLLFGLPWQLFIAWIVSGLGKEAALGAMSALFGVSGSSIQIIDTMQMSGQLDLTSISAQMTALVTPAQALAFVFAFAFNIPCTVALASTYNEIHSAKWTAIITGYYIASSLAYAFIMYHIGLVIF